MRPNVKKIADALSLFGFVKNDKSGVEMEVEGDERAVEEFERRVIADAPPSAKIDEIVSSRLPYLGYERFSIEKSGLGDGKSVSVPVDLPTCGDCKAEMLSPSDRRSGYAFINCTNCGPRYTIIKSQPYDRPATTMAQFEMCPECRAEYEDASNRRFHAQPIACPNCGPALFLKDAQGGVIECRDPVGRVIEEIIKGKIVAIKGIGGFHLACDARSADAVASLRTRKRRDERPFAVMFKNMAEIKKAAHVSAEEEKLLASYRAPIVLLKRKTPFPFPESVCAGLPTIGAFLPYAPLHALLFESENTPGVMALVMTSCNVHDEPIVYIDSFDSNRLARLADFTLTHNRPILVRCDDSVAAVYSGAETVIRRARGYVPQSQRFAAPFKKTVLAVGAELKSAVCLCFDEHAVISQHIGDLQNVETFDAFLETIGHLESLFETRPEAIVRDLHPDFLSSRYAEERAEKEGLQIISLQHHAAHALSCMAENGLREESCICFAFDGTGLGSDGAIWGGEAFAATPEKIKRVGHIEYFPQPLGDKNAKRPWMTALCMARSFAPGVPLPASIARYAESGAGKLLDETLKLGAGKLLRSSSMGRLFDAVSALLDVKTEAAYEAQAALALESVSLPDVPLDGAYETPIERRGDMFVARIEPLINGIIADIERGAPASDAGGRFHAAVVSSFTTMAEALREKSGINNIVLSGGCFLNRILAERFTAELKKRGFDVYIHGTVPSGDGGVSLGQAYYAWRLQNVHGYTYESD